MANATLLTSFAGVFTLETRTSAATVCHELPPSRETSMRTVE